MRLDAHQHFWTLARGDYGWLTADLEVLYRDYGPEDLTPMLKAAGIEGTVLVQAAPTVAETEFMLGLTDRNSFIKGVVGWVDFESPGAPDEIGRLAQHPALVGLRPMIQDIADPDWMLRGDLAPAFAALIGQNLTFDALVLPHHLSNLRRLLERYPQMRVVIDHGAKPRIADGDFRDWATDMAALDRDTSALCKLSGLVTEAAVGWTVDDLKPYVAHLLDTFGAERLIWGSDWPVCTLASSYERWLEATDILLADLDRAAQSAILGGNATRAYRLRE
ncbi:MAG: amidohydrolase [Ruegeria sp.]|uniref:amidohydrolase family protein n=1 Tax=Ruegeria sp. TaxID=1879320 RepID=UPI00349E9B2D